MLLKTCYLGSNQLLGNNTKTSTVDDAWPTGQKFWKIFLIWFNEKLI